MKERIQLIQLKNVDEEEIRRLNYKEAVIDLTQWKTRGYRQIRKMCQIRFPDGSRKELNCFNTDPKSFSRYETNDKLFREAKEEIRDWHKQRKVKPNAIQK